MPTKESGVLKGVIAYQDKETGIIAGKIGKDTRANFSIQSSKGQYEASILDYDNEYGYEVKTTKEGTFLLAKSIDQLICYTIPPPPKEEPLRSFKSSSNQSLLANLSTVPKYSSNSSSSNVLYLDFDGQYVVSPYWNGGNPINAQPASLDGDSSTFNPDEVALIYDIWRGVSEDFSPFNVNVTTDVNVFNSTPSSKRQRNIITPTAWYPNAGGVGHTGHFGRNNDPAWTFYFSTAGMLVSSHELGHYLGLSHDGLYSAAYHPGIGEWGPIMGAPYGESLTTWSKGDYSGADNTENDTAIVASFVGYRNDSHGNTNSTATLAQESQNGIIGASNDKDVFYIDVTDEKRIIASLNVNSDSPNLDAKLSLYGPTGNLIGSNNPVTSDPNGSPVLNASISKAISQSGRYYIHVQGVGYTGSVYSYSSYGSMGQYSLSAMARKATVAPILYLLLLE